MFENIFAGILTVFAVIAAVFGWWLENGKTSVDNNKDKNSKKDKE